MRMQVYDIIKPANEAELGKALRDQPLTGAVLRLTTERQLSELEKWNGVEPSTENLDFNVETIFTARPTAVLGRVAINGIMLGEGRINALSDSEDDEQNKLSLTIVEY